jgi:hypothetical protein
MVKYKDVRDETTEEYFGGNQFSIDAFNKKYRLHEKESYVDAIWRVCKEIASIEETPELKKFWAERWFDEIYNDWWHPAGSIMQGAGSGRKISLANCFSRDTEFITDVGVKSFENFEDGDDVNVLVNTGTFKPAKVKNFGTQKLVKLTVHKNTTKKEIYCTPDHIWRTLNSNESIIEKTTKDLREGDILPHISRKYMTDINSVKKNRNNWTVDKVEESNRTESVWCVVEPETQNFTLAGGVNTHNCTTISLGTGRDEEEWDSLESIIRNAGYTVAKTAAYRQGLGIDFSRLRPRKTTVLNSAVESEGAVHWMEFIDSIGYKVGQKEEFPPCCFL